MIQGENHTSQASSLRRAVQILSKVQLPILLAAVFFCLCAYKISYIGSYADELHQAIHSLCYISDDEGLCSGPASLGGIRLMNNPYIGAIKSHIYGLYLKLAGDFDLVSWRIYGVVLGSAFLLAFLYLLKDCLHRPALLAIGLLLITDVTVIMTTRHDWGPTTLNLGLRYLLVAFWIRGVILAEPAVKARYAFAACAAACLTVFEKLSSVVLFAPLGLCLWQLKAWRKTFLPWAAAGAAFGFVPLVLVNLISLLKTGIPVSLASLSGPIYLEKLTDFAAIGKTTLQYLALGAGDGVKWFILGAYPEGVYYDIPINALELGCMLALLAISVLFILQSRPLSPRLKLASSLLLSYFAIWILLCLLPRVTWVHHWITGTPFHYAALALVLEEMPGNIHIGRWLRLSFLAALILLMAGRAVNVAGLELAFHQEQSSPAWTPELHAIGDFADRHAHDGLFIAADWGVMETIRCASNNQATVYGLYDGYAGKDYLDRVISSLRPRRLYIVGLSAQTAYFSDNTRSILSDVESLEGWNRSDAVVIPGLEASYIIAYDRLEDAQ